MHKFIKKLALIIATSLLSIIIVYALLFASSAKVTSLAREAFYSLNKSGRNSGLHAVILGDSVCNQLWPQRNDSPGIAHLSCNQAITPAGTYLLLKKYLEHNPQTQDVYYIISPATLGNDLNMNFTYQYFVIPFINPESMKLLDEGTRKKLYDKFGKFFVENKTVKELLLRNNYLMEIYLTHIRKQPEAKYIHRLSPTALIYLPKIRSLCSERGIKLHILPIPLADASNNYGWDDFNQDVKDYGLEDILGDFIEKIHYYPEDWYSDGIHFKYNILEQHRDELRSVVMK